MQISVTSLVSRNDNQVSAEVDDEIVMMSVERGSYYGLDQVGTRVWALLEAPMSVGAVCDALMQEFEVDRATCERDLLAFFRQLAEQGLIEVTDGPAA